MGFILVTNFTTGEGVNGTVQVNEDTPQSYGSLEANGGSAKAINGVTGNNLTVKITVDGAPHNGQAVASGLNMTEFGVLVLQITQNGYVNYFTQESAVANPRIQ